MNDKKTIESMTPEERAENIVRVTPINADQAFEHLIMTGWHLFSFGPTGTTTVAEFCNSASVVLLKAILDRMAEDPVHAFVVEIKAVKVKKPKHTH